MWCLSACRVMLVSVVFAVCGLEGIFAYLKAASISSAVCFLVVDIWLFLLMPLKVMFLVKILV